MVDQQRTQFSLATKVPERRIELRFGKMGLPDLFDLNNPGSDSHLQFMNWTADNNGAWDYAADTRGYTYALTAEYDDADWTGRFALALMPTVANGIDMQWNLHRARGENYELDWNHGPLSQLLTRFCVKKDRKGAVRLLWLCQLRQHGQLPLAEQSWLGRAYRAGDYCAPAAGDGEVRCRAEF